MTRTYERLLVSARRVIESEQIASKTKLPIDRRIAKVCLENLKNFLRENPFPRVFDPEDYRSLHKASKELIASKDSERYQSTLAAMVFAEKTFKTLETTLATIRAKREEQAQTRLNFEGAKA